MPRIIESLHVRTGFLDVSPRVEQLLVGVLLVVDDIDRVRCTPIQPVELPPVVFLVLDQLTLLGLAWRAQVGHLEAGLARQWYLLRRPDVFTHPLLLQAPLQI